MKTKNTFFFKLKCTSFLLVLFLIGACPILFLKASSSQLDNTKTDWWLVRAKNHETPGFNDKLHYKLETYDGYCLGDTTRKVVYLTFDEGYENGYTAKILDALKGQNVKAMFFVTLPYVRQNPDLIKRMAAEGHYVCNHTDHHLSIDRKSVV